MNNSLYDFVDTRLDSLLNRGYDYEGNIFRKTMSPYIYADQKRSNILDKFETIIFFLIEKVKGIKVFYNYTVSKNYTKLR